MPMISIIVTVFNLEEYISDCLESIRAQDFTDFEVIIINDGSTDRSEKIINNFLEDKRFKIYSTDNRGVSEARNIALDLSLGRYIIFVDGDDIITKNCLSTSMSSIGNNDILVFNYKSSVLQVL